MTKTMKELLTGLILHNKAQTIAMTVINEEFQRLLDDEEIQRVREESNCNIVNEGDNGWRSKGHGVCCCCGLMVHVDQNDCCEACDKAALLEGDDND